MKKIIFIILNIVGGIAVLGSYVYYLQHYPELKTALWGGIPQSIQPVYTICMFAAAAGYFFFTSYILFRLPEQMPINLSTFSMIYALILVFSALWMPSTAAYIQNPGATMWVFIRIVLFIVGLASVALLIYLLKLRPQEPGLWYWLAIIGLIPFCIQTAILDALIWPALFK